MTDKDKFRKAKYLQNVNKFMDEFKDIIVTTIKQTNSSLGMAILTASEVYYAALTEEEKFHIDTYRILIRAGQTPKSAATAMEGMSKLLADITKETK